MVRTVDEAVALIETICAQPGNDRLIEDAREQAQREGLERAVREHDTPALYDWLMEGFSLQGISDAIALGYIEKHGNATWAGVSDLLQATRCACPKLKGFNAYRDCSYRKALATCARPQHLRLCPVRKLPLRKGALNVQAFSLFLFLRDFCAGDLIGFIDEAIWAARQGGDPEWVAAARRSLVGAFSQVDGVSTKLANMTLSGLLIGGRPGDDDWMAVGASMIAVDTLVHNVLARTGVLAAFGAEHRYGVACYGPNGCEVVLRAIAGSIDASRFGPDYPPTCPWFIQKAVWRFATAGQLGICNAASVGTSPDYSPAITVPRAMVVRDAA